MEQSLAFLAQWLPAAFDEWRRVMVQQHAAQMACTTALIGGDRLIVVDGKITAGEMNLYQEVTEMAKVYEQWSAASLAPENRHVHSFDLLQPVAEITFASPPELGGVAGIAKEVISKTLGQ